MTQHKVIAAWSSTVPHRVLDDGSEWIFDGPDGKWSRFTPPLPPEALGEVAGEADEIKVGDAVAVAGRVTFVDREVVRVSLDGNMLYLPRHILTKVPR